MPRTEPGADLPVADELEDRLRGRRTQRSSQRRNRCSAGTSQRVAPERRRRRRASASPSRAASAQTSSIVVQPCSRANHSGTPNEKSKPTMTGGAQSLDERDRLARGSTAGSLSTSRPSCDRREPDAARCRLVCLAPDQSTAITVGSGTPRRLRCAHARRSGVGGARPRQGLPPRPRGRRHRRRRARGRARRAARSERRGQDHDAAHDPRRRVARRGRGRRSAASISRTSAAAAAECVGFAAGYLPLTERMRVREYLRSTASSTASPIRTRASTRGSSASGSRTSPTRWAPSCRRGSAR